MNNLIIIPAYNPDDKLIKLIDELGAANILVVDDGSKSKEIFKKLEKKKIKVIYHDVNKGKGAALKTALSEYSNYFKNIDGFITCDADGQHSPKDIKKIDKMLSDTIIFGVRDFSSKGVPLRSKIGNRFSSIYFYLTKGVKLNDTQTGLRGFPKKYESFLLSIDGDRFDWEMNVLNAIAKENIEIKVTTIDTIYEEHKSNFKTIKDSFIIYKDFFKYSLVSIVSAILDIVLFAVIVRFKRVMIATIIARILSGLFNFIANKKYSFRSNGKTISEFIKYVILFIIVMLTSGYIVDHISNASMHVVSVKIVVDILLFILSYYIQKKYIFKNKKA